MAMGRLLLRQGMIREIQCGLVNFCSAKTPIKSIYAIPKRENPPRQIRAMDIGHFSMADLSD
jgi:hypothetical protein